MEVTGIPSVSSIREGESVSDVLKAPFPWPGGKSTVADMVWERLGNVDNYVEPFAGSLACLLRRPDSHFEGKYRVETVNDLNHFVANFWRAVKSSPDEVAKWADNPVIEADLHARHQWLMRSETVQEFKNRFKVDPDYYDAKIAGWWVWGQCCWIGTGWCHDDFTDRKPRNRLLKDNGINSDIGLRKKMPRVSNNVDTNIVTDPSTDWQQTPELGHASGRGVTGLTHGRPQLADAFDIGRGVNANGNLDNSRPQLFVANGVIGNLSAQIDDLSGSDGRGVGVHSAKWNHTCEARQEWLKGWMRRLSDRLRLVRTCYGYWDRICDSPSTMTRLGTTGVFLDPPYPTERADTGERSRDGQCYGTDKGQDLNELRDAVLAWCRKWADDNNVRIALCCYEGDGYEPLLNEGWTMTAWKTQGGYSNQGKKKNDNNKRERILWSPHCVAKTEITLFEM